MIERSLDLLLVLMMLVLLSAALTIVAPNTRPRRGSPLTLAHERLGLHRKVFRMHSFLHMSDSEGYERRLSHHEQQPVRFGRMLCSTSPDELLGLIKVLTCDMSFVEPRPLFVGFLTLRSCSQLLGHKEREYVQQV